MNKAKELFKEITEAYAILSDDALRAKYDRLIFGDSASRSFEEDEETYEYWSNRHSKRSRRVREEYEEMQEKVREKLKNFKDYDDFLRNFEAHRDKHEARSSLLREEGWKELNDKLGPSVDEKFVHDADQTYNYKYNSYGHLDRYYEGYWDSKANHLYYSQSAAKRAYLSFKKVSAFYLDISPIILVALACTIYNSK